MRLDAVVTRADLVELVESLTPVAVVMDDRRRRTLSLGRPALELVPDRGVRLRGDGRVTWDIGGVAVPLTVEVWQAVLVPRVTADLALAFDPAVEVLELGRVPAFLDARIADAVRAAVARVRHRLAWALGRSLTRRIALPATWSPARALSLHATDASVSVTGLEIRLTVGLRARFEEAAAERSERVAAPLARAAR